MADIITDPKLLIDASVRQCERLVEDCLIGLSTLLHGGYVQIGGKQYLIKVLKGHEEIIIDIEGLPGFDHIEFVIRNTGWGRDVAPPQGEE